MAGERKGQLPFCLPCPANRVFPSDLEDRADRERPVDLENVFICKAKSIFHSRLGATLTWQTGSGIAFFAGRTGQTRWSWRATWAGHYFSR